MHEPKRKWTIYLIHHTHTDIGYTDTQTRIGTYHLDFIDTVLELFEAARAGGAVRDFRWTMECFWSVERWLAQRDESDRERFAAAVREGFIGLSATYLHFNELIDEVSMCAAVGRASAYGQSIGVPVETAVSADINGFSWGYAQALHDCGVRQLVNCVHSHHGLAPIGRRQLPFFWETPQGDRLWVWNGEHYMLGNVLGVVPEAVLNYVFDDEYKPTPASRDHRFYAERRLPAYLCQLEEDGYPFDFVPLHVGGMITDNAPPNPRIAEFAAEWNERHGESMFLKMVTADEFARRARKADFDTPVYRGDWPDWWSDGLAGCPMETRLLRKAQRGLARLRSARDTLGVELPEPLEREAEQEIRLYCEHTFNHSDAMADPWDLDGKLIGLRKKAGAATALDRVVEAEEAVSRQSGGTRRVAMAPPVYKVVNAYGESLHALARLYLESSEFDGRDIRPVLCDEEGQRLGPMQKSPAPRGFVFHFPIRLEPGEVRTYTLAEGYSTARFAERNFNDRAAIPGLVSDVAGSGGEGDHGCRGDSAGWRLSSPWVEIVVDREAGIVSWQAEGRSLLADGRAYAPLTPVYEHTPVPDPASSSSQMAVRGRMGRNRKGADVRRYTGRFINLQPLESGPFETVVRLDFEMEGASVVHVELRLQNWTPRVTWTVRLNKASLWDPENVFLALPFDAGADEPGQLWLDKSGAAIRPVKDQLPETLTDWYCLQAGYAACSPDFGIAVATPDAPLLQLGPLDFGVRQVAGYPGLERLPRDAFSWLMTNYWETNFEASLGGFHAATFHLAWGKPLAEPAKALAACRQLNREFLCYRSEQ